MAMFSQSNATMAPPQKPETFMLSDAAQQSLPQDAQVALQQVDNLKYFLISAPVDWTPDQYIRRFLLPTGEYVSCVLWNNLFHISGTDIVRCLSFRFQAFGRPVKNSKKFEEGIFSDLRNLKSGTDASLEEPKSAFLDFMYKNNCIRTQKKQKVFYWYSVPHDRLFLDALERDLKREKMGQEATTMAVNEPALSFEFDSSQSLFEQLTKAQQANTSSFSANASSAYSQSTSPVLRAQDSMPPPSLVPQSTMPTVSEEVQTPMGGFSAVSMPPTAATSFVKREQDYGQIQYDRNGIPLSRVHQRHTSMPTYMEYSPAPSFVSSQYEDYSNRGISFEPVTPPQHAQSLGPEPQYIVNEDTGLYTTMPDPGQQNFGGMMQMPAANMSTGQFTGNRGYPSNNVYSVIEGSPTYKQRRRRSSIPPQVNGVPVTNQHAPHKGSDLRRSVSVSVGPEDGSEDNQYGSPAPPSMSNNYANVLEQMSRHGTPMQTLEGSPAPPQMPLMQSQENMANYHANSDVPAQSLEVNGGNSAAQRGDRPGPIRRARSATMMELGPYPHKSHSCPIPTCGRLFKRLEHLKRHVRTHTQERPYVCPHCSKAFSRSDNLAQHRRTHEARPDGEIGPYTDEDDLEAEEENDFGGLDDDESPPPTLPPPSSSTTEQQQQQHHSGSVGPSGGNGGGYNMQNGMQNAMANMTAATNHAMRMPVPATGMSAGHAHAGMPPPSTHHMMTQHHHHHQQLLQQQM